MNELASNYAWLDKDFEAKLLALCKQNSTDLRKKSLETVMYRITEKSTPVEVARIISNVSDELGL
jgi:hypothetical protein